MQPHLDSSIQLVHPFLDETIPTLATVEMLEMYNQADEPDYPNPEAELPTEAASIEETKVHAWVSACIMLQLIRFPSNSKWIVDRENGFPHPQS